jgi:hypothetical protein
VFATNISKSHLLQGMWLFLSGKWSFYPLLGGALAATYKRVTKGVGQKIVGTFKL